MLRHSVSFLGQTAPGHAYAEAKGVGFGRKLPLTVHQQEETSDYLEAGETLRSVAGSYNV